MQPYAVQKVSLSQLALKPGKVSICVKVMRKWAFRGDASTNPIKYVGLIVADDKGDVMYGQILEADVQQKEPLIEVDKVYTITKFNVRTCRKTYVPFDKELMIEFTSFTTVVLVREPSTGFPEYFYNLTPYSQICPVGLGLKKLTDVLGIITSVDNPKTVHLKDKEQVATIREITIKNLSHEEMKITLWGDQATEFVLPHTNDPSGSSSVVALFMGCLPRSISHKTQLSGGYACRWLFNPAIKEAEPFYDSLKYKPVPVYQPPLDTERTQQPVQPIILEHKSLIELNSVDPFEFPSEGYKCTVTITDVPQDKRWSYVGCENCKKSASQMSSPFVCSICQWKETKLMYMLSFTAQDDTAAARFFCYDEAARMIVHRNVEAVLRQARNEPGFPQFLIDIISKKFTLSVALTPESFRSMDSRTYLVKRVLPNYEQQPDKRKELLLTTTTGQCSSSSSVQVDKVTPLHDIIDSTTLLGMSPPGFGSPQTPHPTGGLETDAAKRLVPTKLFTVMDAPHPDSAAPITAATPIGSNQKEIAATAKALLSDLDSMEKTRQDTESSKQLQAQDRQASISDALVEHKSKKSKKENPSSQAVKQSAPASMGKKKS